MPAASRAEIITAYRHFHKSLLRAVKFATPARYIVRDRLRMAFRDETGTYDAARIARTLEFIHHAGETNGLEHRILKNILHVYWGKWRSPGLKFQLVRKGAGIDLQNKAYLQFFATLEKFNDSMGMCLR